jgi:hypothetical protein
VTASTDQSWALAVFPLAAAIVALAFGVALGRRYAARRRPAEGIWALAMAMYAVASFCAFLGVGSGWGAPGYRLFWLFGAVLNVPYLAVGEAFLLVRRPGALRVLVWTLAVVTVAAAAISLFSEVRTSELAVTLPLGKDVWGSASAAYQLRWLSWLGYGALLGGLVWSVRSMQHSPAGRARAAGILAIAFGATIVAIGSGVGAGLGVVPVFSIGLAVGIAVMFWGFLRAVRPSPPGAEVGRDVSDSTRAQT